MLTNPLVLTVVLIALVLAGAYLFVNARERKPVQKKGRRHRSVYRSTKRSPFVQAAPFVLLAASVAFLAIAFTQFRLSRQVSHGTVILAIDTSDSMLQTDVTPSRFDAAKHAAAAFLNNVPPDFRVGLVTFAGTATLAVPPTLDRSPVNTALAGVTIEHGTVIGDGLTTALDAMEASWKANGKGRDSIVLLTDGEDTGSSVSPLTAASRAKALGVKVTTVALGTPTPTGGADTSLLQQIAANTGGEIFTPLTSDKLTADYANLGSALAIGHSAGLFVALAALAGLAAGAVLLVSTRRQKF